MPTITGFVSEINADATTSLVTVSGSPVSVPTTFSVPLGSDRLELFKWAMQNALAVSVNYTSGSPNTVNSVAIGEV